ncbi:MAG: biotin/lipoyl-binding protein, partial [Rhodospirillaceae bacterium]|nr:biotin/lipoyl-binding protein [Rhodospirillaceae bacterium]
LGVLAVAACSRPAPQALGTLEFDRIGLPSPAAERIVAVAVHEGERVAAGQLLLKLDPTRTQAQLAAAQAQAQRARAALAELEAGPRAQDIAQARASLAAALAEARAARAYLDRLLPLQGRNYVAAADLDRARAAADNAAGKARAAQAAAGRQQRNRLEHVGFARAVGAGQHHRQRRHRDLGAAIAAEIGQAQPGERQKGPRIAGIGAVFEKGLPGCGRGQGIHRGMGATPLTPASA